jgi:hypothetical protein
MRMECPDCGGKGNIKVEHSRWPLFCNRCNGTAWSTLSLRDRALSPPLGVIRVRTKETLIRPDIAQLIMRGARQCGFPVPSAILAELSRCPGDDHTGLFLGTIGGEARVVTVGFLPSSAFWLAANVGMAYSEKAPRQLVALVAEKLRDWYKENGHSHVLVANLLHTDRSYMMGLKHFGRPSVAGSVIRFDWSVYG